MSKKSKRLNQRRNARKHQKAVARRAKNQRQKQVNRFYERGDEEAWHNHALCPECSKAAVPSSEEAHNISARLTHLADPLLQKSVGEDDEHMAIFTTVMAWNIALLPPQKGKEYLNKEIEHHMPLTKKGRRNYEEIVNFMIQRKKELYPEDERLIVDYRFKCTKDEQFLDVAVAIKETQGTDSETSDESFKRSS